MGLNENANMTKTTLNTTEIAKAIRKELKELKGFKFSVTTEHFSGGSAINLNIMEAPTRMRRIMSEIPERNRPQYANNYTRKQIETMQGAKYHQLSHYIEGYDPETWNNGVFITEEGNKVLMEIMEIVSKYQWDESNSSIDYFCTNFYLHLGLGKYDKDFIDGE